MAMEFQRMTLQNILVGLSTIAAVAGFSPGQDIDWINPAGGSFDDPSNWNPAVVPSTSERIRFDLPNSYEVTGSSFIVSVTNVQRSDLRLLLINEDDEAFAALGDLSIGSSSLDHPGSLVIGGEAFIDADSVGIGSGQIASRLILDPRSTFLGLNQFALRDAASLEFRVGGPTPFVPQLRLLSSFDKLDGSFAVDAGSGFDAPILGSRRTLIRAASTIEPSDFPFVVIRPRPGRTFDLSLTAGKTASVLDSTTAVSDTFTSISLAESDELGDIPTHLLTADLNGNGRDDLVVLVNSGVIRVYESLPGGVFDSPTEYTVCSKPVDASAGDFDQDGNLDIAVGCQGDNTLLFLLNPSGDPSMLVSGPSTIVDGEIRSLASTSFSTASSFVSKSGAAVTVRGTDGRGRTKGYVIEGLSPLKVADVEVGDEPGPSDPVDEENKKDPEEPIGVGGLATALAGSGSVPILTVLKPTNSESGFETIANIPLTGVAVDFATSDLDGDGVTETFVVTENGHLDLIRTSMPSMSVRSIHLEGFATSIAIGEIEDGGGAEIVIGLSDPPRIEIYRRVAGFSTPTEGNEVQRITLERSAVQFLGEAPTDVAVATVDGTADESEVVFGLPGGGSAPSVNVTEVESQPVPPCTFADFNGDGFVNAVDLAYILGYWGPCAASDPCHAFDLNDDGFVNSRDLGLLVSDWGPCLP
ncbi:MAG: hypothetical protein CMJ51_04710 [Planctomycetaceae bacterium]|nr:hypothetical protein [Planctomycetaceae bacterium]